MTPENPPLALTAEAFDKILVTATEEHWKLAQPQLQKKAGIFIRIPPWEKLDNKAQGELLAIMQQVLMKTNLFKIIPTKVAKAPRTSKKS
jgi:hypothetical protein